MSNCQRMGIVRIATLQLAQLPMCFPVFVKARGFAVALDDGGDGLMGASVRDCSDSAHYSF